MKHLLAALLALCVLPVSAQNPPPPEEAVPLDSIIDEVTVFPDRAQVTRSAAITLQPETARYSVTKLPGWIDENSVRVSVEPAAGAEVVDVQVKREQLARSSDAEVREAEATEREVSARMAALEDAERILAEQKKQVEGIKVFATEFLPKEAATRPIDISEYAAVVEFVGVALTKIAAQGRDLAQQRYELGPELEARQRSLSDLRGRAQLQETTITVAARGPAAGATLRISYLLPGATWEPVHDLRTEPDAPEVTLVSYASVSQTTGEDWPDVKLTFSTQRPMETVRIPELEALLVGSGRPLPQITNLGSSFAKAQESYTLNNGLFFNNVNADDATQQMAAKNLGEQAARQHRAEVMFSRLQERGTTARFSAGGRQAVHSSGQTVRVPLASIQLLGEPKIIAAPEVSLNATRTTELENSGEKPILPGRVSLYRGGAFLGVTETDFVAPGEPFALYLGVADEVKLSRTLDRAASEISRWGNGTRMQVAFVITVENLSERELTVQVADRIPVSETDEVRVKNVRVTPDSRPDAKGVVRWPVQLAPKATEKLRLEYAIEYPTDLPTRKGGEADSMEPRLRMQLLDLEKRF